MSGIHFNIMTEMCCLHKDIHDMYIGPIHCISNISSDVFGSMIMSLGGFILFYSLNARAICV